MMVNVNTLTVAFLVFVGAFIAEQVILILSRVFGLFAVVRERTSRVYVLFGKVIGVIDEPGLYFLPAKLGPAAFIVNLLGTCNVLDLRLDQEYLRSQPVNSEEGAPMGIGIWYEMWVSDPVSYLFKNTDPRGSLRANVSNATVRCLSNMPLAEMLQTRHNMSQTVRAEVTSKSRNDSPDRRKSGEPAAAGDVRDQAGRRESGQRDHQLGGARSGGGVCQGRGHPARHAGAGVPGNRARSGGGADALRDPGDATDSGQQREAAAAARRMLWPHAGQSDCGGF